MTISAGLLIFVVVKYCPPRAVPGAARALQEVAQAFQEAAPALPEVAPALLIYPAVQGNIFDSRMFLSTTCAIVLLVTMRKFEIFQSSQEFDCC